MPADCRGIKQHGRALQRGEARAFRKPLIPADERAQPAGAGVQGTKPEISGCEIKLLVVKRVVGDVHLAVEAAQRAVGIEDGGGIVIDPGGTFLEQRRDYYDVVLSRRGGESLAGRPGN